MMADIKKRPHLEIDFSRKIDSDLYVLSKDDVKLDENGNSIKICTGMEIYVFVEDVFDDQTPAIMMAPGVAVLNNTENNWTSNFKWACRLTGPIEHISFDEWHKVF